MAVEPRDYLGSIDEVFEGKTAGKTGMVATKSAKKAAFETQKKPFIVCGFLGVFWNNCSGATQPEKAPSEEKLPPEAKLEPFCVRPTCKTEASSAENAAEKKVLLENFEHLHAQGSRGASRKMHYGPEDHLGSTRMVLAQDGTVKEALMYQPYGTVSDVEGLSAPRTDPLRQKFTTKEYDEEGITGVGTYQNIKIDNMSITTAISGVITHGDGQVTNLTFAYQYTWNGGYYYCTGLSRFSRENLNITSISLHIADGAVSFDYVVDGLDFPITANHYREITLDRTINEIAIAAQTNANLYDISAPQQLKTQTISWFYFGARYLDPDLGIWNSTDPANQFWNAYSYAGGDVIGSVDPDGRKVRRSKFWKKFTNIAYSIANPIAYFERASDKEEWDPSENYDTYFFGWSFGDQSGPVLGDPTSGAGTITLDLPIGGGNDKKDDGNSKPPEKKPEDKQQEEQQSPGGTSSTDGVTSTGNFPLILPRPMGYKTIDSYTCPGGECRNFLELGYPYRYVYDGITITTQKNVWDYFYEDITDGWNIRVGLGDKTDNLLSVITGKAGGTIGTDGVRVVGGANLDIGPVGISKNYGYNIATHKVINETGVDLGLGIKKVAKFKAGMRFNETGYKGAFGLYLGPIGVEVRTPEVQYDEW